MHVRLVPSADRRTIVSQQDNLFNRCTHGSILCLSTPLTKPGEQTPGQINRKYVTLSQAVKYR